MIKVSAAIIKNSDGDLLICQRKSGGSCAYLWEFPGGKQEEGESPEACLIRECEEELGVKVRITGLYANKKYQYPENEYFFSFYTAEITSGNIMMLAHNDLAWVPIDELEKYAFCPADVDIVNQLTHEKECEK